MIVIPFCDSFTMKLCVWTLTNDTSYNETSLTKRRFGHRFELELNKESRLITPNHGKCCVWTGGSVTSVTNWAGLNMTSSERRPDLSFPLPFHDRSSKLRTYTTFRCRVSGLLSSVCGHPGIYRMIIYTTFLVCGHSEIYTMILYTTFRYRVSG